MNMKLSGLERPPAEEEDIERFLAQLKAAPRLDDALADDLEHHEIRKAEGGFQALEQHAEQARTFARRIGLKSCEESDGSRPGGSSLF